MTERKRECPYPCLHIYIWDNLGGYNIGKKYTNDEFVRKVFEQVGEQYRFLEEYKGVDKKISILHEKCGHVYSITPYHFLTRKQRCPMCNKMRKRTHEEYVLEFEERAKGEYTLLSKYRGARETVKIKHNVCGNVYWSSASGFKHGSGCLKCAQKEFHKARKKTHDKFKSEVVEIGDNEYELLDRYQKDDLHVTIRHKICGTEYKVQPSSFLQGSKCPICMLKQRIESQRWTQEYFEEFVEKEGLGEYQVVGDYKSSQVPVEMIHLKCGTKYTPIPRTFVSGGRCPHCRSSRGEQYISQLLRRNNIKNKEQFKFDNCRRDRPLPFDFVLFDEKDNPYIAIEYHGIQHYQPVDFFGGEKQLIRQQENDRIKKKFCNVNNILYIEIPYFMTREQIDKLILNYANHEPSLLETT